MTKKSPEEPIFKTRTGFTQECEQMTLEWDHCGKYRGQWQDDALGDGDRLFIGRDPTGKFSVPDLTPVQIAIASADTGEAGNA